jgi:hypothetical protein
MLAIRSGGQFWTDSIEATSASTTTPLKGLRMVRISSASPDLCSSRSASSTSISASSTKPFHQAQVSDTPAPPRGHGCATLMQIGIPALFLPF